VLKLPASMFGKKRLEPRDSFFLDSSFTTHGRASRLAWHGEYLLED
jgi:hypothetical protein